MTSTQKTSPGWRVTLNVDALIQIRFLAGYSQAELARQAGLSQGHMSELERGDKNPRPATIKKLATALSVPVEALIRQEVYADA